MKKKMSLAKFATALVAAIGTFTSVNAQTNLGASCGCPAVGSRTSINVSSMSGAVAIAGDPDAYELTTGASFTCNNTYILDKKIYVPAGQTLTIEPGTLIKGATAALPADATALVIERGGTIIAAGTEDCPIVFTAQADPMDGSYAISNTGMWGGITILGRAHNNLTLAANGTAPTSGRLALADGIGVVEGYANVGFHNRHGVLQAGTLAGETLGAFDNNDNSGIMKYCSIRHTGAVLEVGAEINALTLGSVGAGTTLEHIEIVSCGDDNIEFFGGTVNLKYCTTLFGNDDMFDWDLGWTGKAQFLFGMKSTTSSSVDSDSGFEADGDDQKSNNTPRSHPIIYNVTLIGNSKPTGTSDNSGLAAINAKEFTEGEIYNSIFANFRNGFNMVQAISGTRSYPAGGEAWHNWTNSSGTTSATVGNGSESLKVVCNTFVNCTNNLTTGASSGSAGTNITSGADFTQFDVTDKNDIVASIAGFDYNFNINTTTNVVSVANDVTPTTALSVSGCPTPPVDGFFEPAPYRGAFSSDPSKNWLSDWTYSQVLGSTQGVQACPTDLNLDGQTDINDFLIFAPEFGNSCN